MVIIGQLFYLRQPLEDAVCDMQSAEGMFEASVSCAWVHQIGHRQLTDATQPLEDLGVGYGSFLFGQLDKAVDGVAYLVRQRKPLSPGAPCHRVSRSPLQARRLRCVVAR
jgi:hypothetical protein